MTEHKPCTISFEMSSEEMLEIVEQPSDTCDYNHPLHNAMDYTYNDLRVAVADAPDGYTSFKYLSYEEQWPDQLQRAVDGFDEWKAGWIDCYKAYVEPHISDEEKAMFETSIELINKAEHASDDFYKMIDIQDCLASLESSISEMEDSIERAIQVKQDHDSTIEELNQELREVEAELDSLNDEPFDIQDEKGLALDGEINRLQQEIENAENAEPWDDHIDDANRALESYEEIYSKFGNAMQNHYTELRSTINDLKCSVKHYMEKLNLEGKIPNLLPYPENELTELLSEHSQKETIVVAASPSVFIKKMRRFEIKTPTLEPELRDILMEENSEEALDIAMHLFKQEYPTYNKLFTYADDQEALRLGKRQLISLSSKPELSFAYRDEMDMDMAM